MFEDFDAAARERLRKRSVQARRREVKPWVQWYRSQRWRRARARFLKSHPVCEFCGGAARVIDHVRPHRGAPALFWLETNWRPLCKPCHDRKTARTDGGFGNPSKAGVPDGACDASGHPSDPSHPWHRCPGGGGG